MKIAQIAPLCEAVPPSAYGGTERIVAYLTDALVELGCDVTLFASAEARTRARLMPMRDQAIRLDPHPVKSEWAAHLGMLKQVQTLARKLELLPSAASATTSTAVANIATAAGARVAIGTLSGAGNLASPGTVAGAGAEFG